MLITDLKSHLNAATLLKSQAVTGNTNGPGVDLKGYQQPLLAVFNIAAATAGSSPTMDVKIQDSADNSSWADVSGLTLTQVTTSDSLQTLSIDPRVVRRYTRAVFTIGGTSSPSFPIGAVLLGQKGTI